MPSFSVAKNFPKIKVQNSSLLRLKTLINRKETMEDAPFATCLDEGCNNLSQCEKRNHFSAQYVHIANSSDLPCDVTVRVEGVVVGVMMVQALGVVEEGPLLASLLASFLASNQTEKKAIAKTEP